MAKQSDIIKSLINGFKNNPQNEELYNTLGNIPVPLNPFTLHKAGKSLGSGAGALTAAMQSNDTPRMVHEARKGTSDIGEGILGALASLPAVRPAASAVGTAGVEAGDLVNAVHRGMTRGSHPLIANIEASTASRFNDVPLSDKSALKQVMDYYMLAKNKAYGYGHVPGVERAAKPLGVSQGAWSEELDDAGKAIMQNNPVFHEDWNAHDPYFWDFLRQNLDQYGIGATRFNKQLIKIPEKSNMVRVPDADPEFIKAISRSYAERNQPAVVFAHPDNSAIIYNMMSDSPKELGPLLSDPNLVGRNIEYGRGDIPFDRNYIDDLMSAFATGHPAEK